MGDRNKEDDKTSFTVDTVYTVDSNAPDGVSMPSVTRLLDRKKLGISTGNTPAPKTPPSFVAPPKKPEPSITEPPIERPETTPPKVAPVARRAERRPPATKLIQWQLGLLKSGTDPLGKAIAHFLEKGATCALFLGIAPPPPGSPVPHFVATASASAPGQTTEKLSVWTGLKWDPTVSPEMWNLFVKTGYLEFGPPGTTTNMQSNRNIARSAFGIAPDEWLILVRVGPANGCRGVLAVVSRKSMITELATSLPLLNTAIAPSAAA